MATTFLTPAEALKNANNSANQTIKGEFIGKHVYCNVGPMVEAILKQEDSDLFSFDDVENLYSFPEWSSTVVGETLFFEGGTEEEKETFLENFDRLIEESQDLLDAEEISEETHKRNVSQIEEARQEVEDLEAEMQDVYEWWAVSEYLYEQLQAMGHPVLDAGSCYVWGRCTTGQAILLDHAISRICADMEILEGQANSWAK